MSVRSSAPSEPVAYDPCDYCGGAVTPDTVVEGSFCSSACYYRRKGTNALTALQYDHQICSTCFGRIKEIEPIRRGPDTVREGFQHPTPKTTIGVDVFSEDEYGVPRTEGTRWSCSCGAVDPSTVSAAIQNTMLTEVIANCFRALEYLHDRGKIPDPPSQRRYYAGLREHWRDARYAVGRACYG